MEIVNMWYLLDRLTPGPALHVGSLKGRMKHNRMAPHTGQGAKKKVRNRMHNKMARRSRRVNRLYA